MNSEGCSRLAGEVWTNGATPAPSSPEERTTLGAPDVGRGGLPHLTNVTAGTEMWPASPSPK